jgi:transcription antitermination factor NusG
MGWNVLHVKPRCEKKMAECCRILDVSHYLPLRSETKIYQRRKVTVDKPVFPGYVFATFDRTQRLGVLRTNYVVRIIEPLEQRAFLHELAQVRRALRVDPTLGAVEALKKGRRVRITGGPFMGVEGVVEALKRSTSVLLNVDMIGQAVAVEVDKDYLELID